MRVLLDPPNSLNDGAHEIIEAGSEACVVFFENMDVASVLDKLSIKTCRRG